MILKSSLTHRIVISISLALSLGWGHCLGADVLWESTHELSPGVHHLHAVREEPRKLSVNCLRVDTHTPQLKLMTTPRRVSWKSGQEETTRQTVRNFIRQSRSTSRQLVAAINADAFSPWPAPYQNEDPTDLHGLAISDGQVVSLPSGTPSLVVTKLGEYKIETIAQDADLSKIETAVSGFSMCLMDGVSPPSGEDLHPRTGIGLSRDQRYLYLLTIDGRQTSSMGATVQEVGLFLNEYGADDGINMDGGGSTTMAWWNPDLPEQNRCVLLNHPVGSGKTASSGTSPDPAERANGNNLGIYYVARDQE